MMYQWKKGIAQWQVGKTLYLSVPFTWLIDEADKIASRWKGRVLKGGPAYQCPQECEGFEPLLFHNPCATFTSRGCPNNCSFCIVNKLEPEFKEIYNFRPAPIICDNNFLASSISHIERVISAVKNYRVIDFQGIDANYVTPEKADLLGKLKCKLHIGYDHRSTAKVHDAVKLLQTRATKDIICYVIIGYKDTPSEAINRLEEVRSWKALPFPMRYQPLEAKEKNKYVEESWTEAELKNVSRYYSRLNWLGHIKFEDYNNKINDNQMQLL